MDIKQIRKYLKEKIKNNQFYGHSEERQQVLDLLQRTINHGESNSALLIGPRNAGKTLVRNLLNLFTTSLFQCILDDRRYLVSIGNSEKFYF